MYSVLFLPHFRWRGQCIWLGYWLYKPLSRYYTTTTEKSKNRWFNFVVLLRITKCNTLFGITSLKMLIKSNQLMQREPYKEQTTHVKISANILVLHFAKRQRSASVAVITKRFHNAMWTMRYDRLKRRSAKLHFRPNPCRICLLSFIQMPH